MICIYCVTDKPRHSFNREHVLPESFGRFRDNLVLHDAVCSDCNRYFGETLDRALARSTSEGLERYSWHVKPASDVEAFRYGDVLLRLEAPESGWHNALVRKVPTDMPGEDYIELVPQAVFKRSDGEGVVHVPLWDLRRGAWRDDRSIDPCLGVRVLAPADVFDEVAGVLAEFDVTFNSVQELEAPQVENGEATIRHHFALTDDLKRSIAKIALNYLTYTNGTELAVEAVFDPVRNFVRFGTQPSQPMVLVVPYTRLGIVRDDGQVPVVHYLTLEHDNTETALLTHVTLFHWAVYQVVLADRVADDLDIRPSGHLFNVSDMTCYAMQRKTRK